MEIKSSIKRKRDYDNNKFITPESSGNNNIHSNKYKKYNYNEITTSNSNNNNADVSNNNNDTNVSKFASNKESNMHRIEARLKQISYGKNSIGYDNYLSAVPKSRRGCYSIHPRTPDPYEVLSKRCFDGKVKAWRRALHKWDNMESIQHSNSNNSNSNNGSSSIRPDTIAPNNGLAASKVISNPFSNIISNNKTDNSTENTTTTSNNNNNNSINMDKNDNIEVVGNEWGADLPPELDDNDDDDVL